MLDRGCYNALMKDTPAPYDTSVDAVADSYFQLGGSLRAFCVGIACW